MPLARLADECLRSSLTSGSHLITGAEASLQSWSVYKPAYRPLEVQCPLTTQVSLDSLALWLTLNGMVIAPGQAIKTFFGDAAAKLAGIKKFQTLKKAYDIFSRSTGSRSIGERNFITTLEKLGDTTGYKFVGPNDVHIDAFYYLPKSSKQILLKIVMIFSYYCNFEFHSCRLYNISF